MFKRGALTIRLGFWGILELNTMKSRKVQYLELLGFDITAL